MAQVDVKPRSLGERMLGIPKFTLYFILILCTSVPLFFNVTLPNEPKPEAIDYFNAISNIPKGSTVLIQSDWTESTRGESRGQFDATVRMLMRNDVKFAVYAVADAQAPEVARNAINDLNAERRKQGDRAYEKWDDWIELGYYPNAEGLGQGMKADIRAAFGAKRDGKPGQPAQPVFQSPVLEKINKLSDVSMLIVITGTKSITIALERLSGKVKIAGMVTGVMGPETLNYYLSHQLEGLGAGLKGTYDVETQMETKWPGKTNLDKGTKYIFTLHIGLFLLILAVVVGNIGVFLTRKGK